MVPRPLVVLGALVLALLGASPASAAAPTEVTAQLSDRTVLLGASDRMAVQEAVSQLAAEYDIGLYAVFVYSFDSLPAGDWAEQTAELSALGESDILLAVAVEGEGDIYEYGWWVDDAFPLLEVDVKTVLSGEVGPELEAQNWAGAVTTLAERLQSLAERTKRAPAAETADRTSAPQWSPTPIVLVGGIAVVLLGAHLLSRRRTSTGPTQ